jgi:hypothetical protein
MLRSYVMGLIGDAYYGWGRQMGAGRLDLLPRFLGDPLQLG